MFGWITLLRITEVNRLKNHFLYCETTQINFHWRRFTQEKTNLCCVNILSYILWLKLVLGDFPRSLLKSLHIAVLLKLVNLEFASSLWKNLHTVVLPKLVNLEFASSLLKSLHTIVLPKLVNLEFASSLLKSLRIIVLPKPVNLDFANSLLKSLPISHRSNRWGHLVYQILKSAEYPLTSSP